MKFTLYKPNAKNPEKSGTIKLSANEAGEVLSSFKTRIPFVAFHRRNDDTTIIKFTPWDKKRKIMGKDGDTWHETPAFGVSVTRNSSMTFKLPLEAGETEVLSELLKKYILESFIVVDAYKPQAPKEESQEDTLDTEDSDVPF